MDGNWKRQKERMRVDKKRKRGIGRGVKKVRKHG